MSLDNTIERKVQMEELYKENFRLILRFCCVYIIDKDAACDLAQDVFYKFYEVMDDVKSTSVKSYLYTSARNTCLNYLRKDKYNGGNVYDICYNLEDDNSFLESLTRNEMIFKIQSAISQLSDKYRLVCLYILDGKSNQEIAEAINTSVNNVKFFKKEIYKILRSKLDKSDFSVLLASIFYR